MFLLRAKIFWPSRLFVCLVISGLATAALARSQKQFRLELIRFNEAAEAEIGENAIREGLAAAGLVAERDYTLSVRSAQGDMASLTLLVEAAVQQQPDMLIPLQPLTLQMALQRVRNTPLVFHLIGNPFVLGAGKTDSAHLPNVTGVYAPRQPDKSVQHIPLFARGMEQGKKVGLLFVPGEQSSVAAKESYTATLTAAGYGVEVVGVDTGTDRPLAIQALLGKGTDAVMLIPGSVVTGAGTAVFAAAKRAKLPVFGFLLEHARLGAVLTAGPDLQKGGVEAGKIVARIMKGEKPANIPFLAITNYILIVNKRAAEAYGVTIPPEIMDKATSIIE